MVSFDAREPGTSVATWRSDPRWATLPAPRPLDPAIVPAVAEPDAPGAFDLVGASGPVVVLAAHPDDETLGAGSLIAQLVRQGRAVTVVVVTDGAASHPRSTSTPAGSLRELRLAEARAALDELVDPAGLGAPIELVALGVADGGLREARDVVRRQLADLLAERRPVLVLAPWRGDGHRDHRVLGEVAAELVGGDGSALPDARLLEYPIWMWHWGGPDHPDVPWDALVRVDGDEEVGLAKQRALVRYSSQVLPLSDRPGDEAVLRPDFVEHFVGGAEVFVEAPAPEPAPASVPADTLAPSFDATHARRDDPWGVTTRWYERRKRALVLASLPDERLGRVLEIGCSIGVVTEQLALRADSVLAVDVSSVAVGRARERLAAQPHVRVEVADVSAGLPRGDHALDLVVLGEVGYYLSPEALGALLVDVDRVLAPGGSLVACHWRHGADDFAQGGDEVHEALAAWARDAGLTRVVGHVEEDFLLDVFSRDPRSVASRTGLR
ncbi:bifunctional PIG-L family deacetylase/class I SAM-dependent methyltransferase [Frigoribacterium sp. PhB116]|uniref:bifunctional PIG-L family deacetylase/class I SAM-dependent methyltransferase n=1 Tax=Frigoribacterium sp. PhB116 TaxID=2485174 RepID=UPI00105EE1D2|nr:bifunctional PIG-L family deacetylase/class I SAM-dependent methyltransferase [Frigoribacterium sp. PhB116]TDT63120.1 LmbE family N-acetylglucosaminyl deacetylase [Frigoribacterium sp. PhB116]